MNQRLSGFVPLVFLFVLVANVPGLAWSAEPQVKILSPTNDSRITQDQNLIFVSGKVAREAGRSANVDIMLVMDISGSTAMYSGSDLGDANQLPDNSRIIGISDSANFHRRHEYWQAAAA